MSFRIRYEKLLQTYKAIWTKTKGLQNNKLNALPASDYSYIKTKIRTYSKMVQNVDSFCKKFLFHFYEQTQQNASFTLS